MLDVEVKLNNLPLTYLKGDSELPVLTPNSMLHINPSYLPELPAHQLPDKDLRKRANSYLSAKKQCGSGGRLSM